MAAYRWSFDLRFLCLIFIEIWTISCFDCKNSEQKLQVHLVPHTHDDVGWLKTVDEYFYGAQRLIQAGSVQYILDTAIEELQKDRNRTFIYVEIAFFKRWWDEKNDEIKNSVKDLVKNKQLEFINGGWSMNDEGASHYNGIIDQMTLGLLFIEENFGSEARPTIAWQIDPFGHSAEQASLFSLMSMDGLFFGRLAEADKQKRKKEQRMEMVWRGSRNYEKQSQIFTGVLYNLYQPPPGFCYDEFCADPPIQDDPRMYDENVKERVDAFVEVTCEQAEHYKTNNIMLTMGSDFQYENALRWYINLDKLIRYVNKDGRINVFYSTPSRYLKALHEANKQWEVKTDDFFPYAHCDHCYWTGYFTSRPTLKGYIRESNNILQTCKQMESFDSLLKFPSSQLLRKAMAVNQHHDAVTGTEKQPVADDYAKRLYIGREECKALMNNYIKKQINKGSSQPITLNFTQCDYLNVSMCHITETEDSFVLNVYNPIGRSISTYVRIPVNSRTYVVLDSYGKLITSQVASVSLKTSSVRRESHGSALYELAFEVSAPALGYATYFIKKANQNNQQTQDGLSTFSEEREMNGNQVLIENDVLKLEFSPESGQLVRMGRKDEDLHVDVDQQFFWYKASVGNAESIQTSGAYIFRPNKSEPIDVCELNVAKIHITTGPIYEEVHQTFGPYVSQVIRLYKHANYAEFEHTVGPIPVDDGYGKEIITRFDTGIESAGKFYTDANGREMKERIRDHRETWKLNITEPVAGNYYPVNSRILINDSNAQLAVMSDRSQGGSSIRDGSIEIMVHRRLLRDDFLGVDELLNEPGITGDGLVTRGRHRVLLSKPKDGAKLHRENGEYMMMAPILSFSKNEYDMKHWNQIFASTYSGLTKPLPDNVHLLTVESIKRGEVILRFENYYEKFERDEVTEVNLDGLFKAFKITKLTEMNLSANQKLSDKQMWNWNTGEEQFHQPAEDRTTSASLVIRLKPMEIRTYRALIELTTNNGVPNSRYENNGYVVF